MKRTIYVVSETVVIDYGGSSTEILKAFSNKKKAERYTEELNKTNGDRALEEGFDDYYTSIDEIELED